MCRFTMCKLAIWDTILDVRRTMYMQGHVYMLGARRASHKKYLPLDGGIRSTAKGQGSSYASSSHLPWHVSQAGGLRPKVPFLLWVC